jgi:hypothetical protein
MAVIREKIFLAAEVLKMKQVVHIPTNVSSSGSSRSSSSSSSKGKVKDIPVTGRGGPYGCERLRLPHYLDKRLTDGGKVVSPTRRVLISVRGSE